MTLIADTDAFLLHFQMIITTFSDNLSKVCQKLMKINTEKMAKNKMAA